MCVFLVYNLHCVLTTTFNYQYSKVKIQIVIPVADLRVVLRLDVLQRGGADEPHQRRVLRHHHAAAAAPNESQLGGHSHRVIGGGIAPEDSVHQRPALALVGVSARDAARLRGGDPVKRQVCVFAWLTNFSTMGKSASAAVED
jgi:hypothetical protein